MEYSAIHRVRHNGWQMRRNERAAIRLPGAPCNALMRHGEPCVVKVTMRRTLCSVGFSRLAPSGSSHATPRAHTRSIQPLSTAGWAPHQVG